MGLAKEKTFDSCSAVVTLGGAPDRRQILVCCPLPLFSSYNNIGFTTLTLLWGFGFFAWINHFWLFFFSSHPPHHPPKKTNKKIVKASRFQDLIRIFCPEFFWAKSGKCESIFRFYTLSRMWFVKILKFGPPKYFEWDLQLIYENIFTGIFQLSLGSYFLLVGTLGCLILLFVFRLWKLTGVFFLIICWVISSNHIPLYQLTYSFKCTYYKYL